MIHQLQTKTKQFILGALVLTFAATACNSKKGDKKDTPKEDTAAKMDNTTPPMKDTTHFDTADTRPVKTPD